MDRIDRAITKKRHQREGHVSGSDPDNPVEFLGQLLNLIECPAIIGVHTVPISSHNTQRLSGHGSMTANASQSTVKPSLDPSTPLLEMKPKRPVVLHRFAQNRFALVSAIWPALILFTVLAFNFIGDALRDALSPYPS